MRKRGLSAWGPAMNWPRILRNASVGLRSSSGRMLEVAHQQQMGVGVAVPEGQAGGCVVGGAEGGQAVRGVGRDGFQRVEDGPAVAAEDVAKQGVEVEEELAEGGRREAQRGGDAGHGHGGAAEFGEKGWGGGQDEGLARLLHLVEDARGQEVRDGGTELAGWGDEASPARLEHKANIVKWGYFRVRNFMAPGFC